MTEKLKWDIFCTVVDNFGDIGVTWRFVKELSLQGKKIRLFLDRTDVLNRFESVIKPDIDRQEFGESVTVIKWSDNTDFGNVGETEAVVEMFACHIPDRYVSQMNDNCLWINVEYLTAEDWIEDCHGLMSLDRGRRKYFFFPGFTEKTGGVNFEHFQITEQYSHSDFTDMLFDCVNRLKKREKKNLLIFSVFTYANNVMADIICRYNFGNSIDPVFIMPEGLLLDYMLSNSSDCLKPIDDKNGNSEIKLFESTSGSTVAVIPMVSQDDYDEILRRCDMNFVRGEDSFIRAQMASKPFIWNIYPQDEQYHLVKLDAFTDKYTSRYPDELKMAYCEFSREFNNEDLTNLQQHFQQIISGLSTIDQHIKEWRNSLIRMGSLTDNIIKFAEKH